MILFLLILKIGDSRKIKKITGKLHLNRFNSIILLYQMIDMLCLQLLNMTNCIENMWYS
jgi:hypothetical protein